MIRSIFVAVTAVASIASTGAMAESLYQESTFRSLVSDNKAHRPGDSITVLVYENSSATSIADTSSQRKNGLGFDFSDSLHKNRVGSIQLTNDFDGKGRTQRAGKLLAQLTVTVVEVAPNGELLVAGQQQLEINNERQQIKLEGRVRPQDISEANTVVSTRLADARISYIGEGDLAARQRPSWWSQLLVWLGF